MKTTEALSDYRDLDAKIFKLVRKKNQTDADIKKIEKLREDQEALIKANPDLNDVLTEAAYNA